MPHAPVSRYTEAFILPLFPVHPRPPRRCASAPRTAAAGGSPRRPRGAPASAQLAVHCRRPARLRSTTPRLCGSCAAALVARRRSPARGSAHTLRPLPPPAAAGHGLRSILGTNSRATQRAGELAAADPAYRARLARRLQLDARSRPETLLGGAPFGHALERALVRGKLVGCGAIQRDVRRLCDAQRTTPSANTLHERADTRFFPPSACLGSHVGPSVPE
eukprot:scaffold14415_cov56-Phaeocystis_antarctica.AAC.4